MIVMEAINKPFDQTSCMEMDRNNAPSRLFVAKSKRSVGKETKHHKNEKYKDIPLYMCNIISMNDPICNGQ